MTYSEQSKHLALEASVAVLVLCNTECTDMEFLPLKPRQMPEREIAEMTAWKRGLRSIGVIGLVGASTRCALKEPLEAEKVSALADAFLAYLHTLFCDSFAEQLEGAEIGRLRPKDDSAQWLTRLWALPDTRD